MNTATSIVAAVLSVPAVLALVNLLKTAGLPSKAAPIASVIIAVLANVSAYLWGENPLFLAVAGGILLGLSAAGLYDVTKPAESTPTVLPRHMTKSVDPSNDATR